MTTDELIVIARTSAGEPDGILLNDSCLDVPFDELGYDSIQVMEIAGHIERSLGVALPDNLLTGTRSLRDLQLAVSAAAARADR